MFEDKLPSNVGTGLATDQAALDTLLSGETQDRSASRKAVSLGLLRIEGTLLAIPVEAIREVVPGQTRYAPLAAWTDGILGAINLRGWVIPIFDPRKSLGMPTPRLGEHVILILRLQGRLLGLVADCVCGMSNISPDDLFKLEDTDKSTNLITHAFQIGDDVASVLDANRVAGLPNLPTVAERLVARQGRSTKTEKLLLFGYGDRHFGIEATAVDATVPTTQFDRSQLANGFCLGVIVHQAYMTPVVETSAALKFVATGHPTEAPVVVVRFGDNAMLAFIVDEVREIAAVAEDRIQAMPYALANMRSLFRGIYTDDKGREHLILDTECLRADDHLSTLANLRRPALGLQSADAPRPAGHVTGASAGPATMRFLTYMAGLERATPLTQVAEILPYPKNVIPFELSNACITGLFTHQGRAIPLVSVAKRLGSSSVADPSRSRVLVVREEDITIGFIIDSLRTIETAQWHSPADISDETKRGALVLVGLGDERRLLQKLDLIAELRDISVTTKASPERDVAPLFSPKPGIDSRVAVAV